MLYFTPLSDGEIFMAVLKLNNIKQRNLSAVLRFFCENDRVSRRDAAAMLGCDHATVTRAVKDLLSAELLAPAGKCGAAHGRPREMITLHSDSPLLLGIELQPRCVTVTAVDLRGESIDRCQADFSPEGKISGFCRALKQCVDLMTTRHPRISGCGMATIGTLDSSGCVITECANAPVLNGFDAAGFWRENFTLPMPHFTDRMPAELYWFMAQDPALRQGIALIADAGEGIGMILAGNGNLLNPQRRRGGELGHNIVIPGGELCRCGRKGCLETYASTGSLLRRSKCRSLNEMKEFLAGQEMLKYAARLFAMTLANQLNNIMPDHAVITGKLLDGGKIVTAEIEQVLAENLFPAARDALHLSFLPGAADAAGGAALLAREEFFLQMEKSESRLNS